MNLRISCAVMKEIWWENNLMSDKRLSYIGSLYLVQNLLVLKNKDIPVV